MAARTAGHPSHHGPTGLQALASLWEARGRAAGVRARLLAASGRHNPAEVALATREAWTWRVCAARCRSLSVRRARNWFLAYLGERGRDPEAGVLHRSMADELEIVLGTGDRQVAVSEHSTTEVRD